MSDYDSDEEIEDAGEFSVMRANSNERGELFTRYHEAEEAALKKDALVVWLINNDLDGEVEAVVIGGEVYKREGYF